MAESTNYNGDSEILIEVSGNPRSAAARLQDNLTSASLRSGSYHRLAGNVQFPKVVVYRSLGHLLPNPFAVFEGTFSERGRDSIIVGRAFVPSSGRVLAGLISVGTRLFIAVALLVMALATRSLVVIAVGLGFFGVVWCYLYVARRMARSGAQAERELLVDELKKVLREGNDS